MYTCISCIGILFFSTNCLQFLTANCVCVYVCVQVLVSLVMGYWLQPVTEPQPPMESSPTIPSFHSLGTSEMVSFNKVYGNRLEVKKLHCIIIIQHRMCGVVTGYPIIISFATSHFCSLGLYFKNVCTYMYVIQVVVH